MGYVVQKLNAVAETRQWLAVRLSYGMNGILLPTAHLADLAAYMKCAPASAHPALEGLDRPGPPYSSSWLACLAPSQAWDHASGPGAGWGMVPPDGRNPTPVHARAGGTSRATRAGPAVAPGFLSDLSGFPARVLRAPRRQHIARYPPDLLWLDWFRGEKQAAGALPRGRAVYVYHKNLLDHLGAHSSFSVRADRPAFPACFQSMADVWSLHAKERFQAVRPRRAHRLLAARVYLGFPATQPMADAWSLHAQTALPGVGSQRRAAASMLLTPWAPVRIVLACFFCGGGSMAAVKGAPWSDATTYRFSCDITLWCTFDP